MKDIPGYEGLYAITRDGQVWSYPKEWSGHSHAGMWLKHSDISGGYPSVCLHSSKIKSKSIAIHRLLALTYIPNPQNKPYINHIDMNKKNFSLDNLEWCTASENTLHSAKYGFYSRKGETNGRFKYSMETRRYIVTMKDRGESFTNISKELSVPLSSVRMLYIKETT